MIRPDWSAEVTAGGELTVDLTLPGGTVKRIRLQDFFQCHPLIALGDLHFHLGFGRAVEDIDIHRGFPGISGLDFIRSEYAHLVACRLAGSLKLKAMPGVFEGND